MLCKLRFFLLLSLLCSSVVFPQKKAGKQEPIRYTKTIYSNQQIDFDIPFETGLFADNFVWSATDNINIIGETVLSSSEVFITDVLINTTNKNEAVIYTISSLDATTKHIVKFIIEPLPSLKLSANSIYEGNDLQVEFKFTKPTVSDSVVILGLCPSHKNGVSTDDVNLDDQFIIVPKGSTEYIVQIPTNDDDKAEFSEDLIISIKSMDSESLVFSETSTKVSILDNDLFPKVVINDSLVNEGNSLEIPIYLEKPALSDVELELGFIDIDTDGDFIKTKKSVVFEAGSTLPKRPVMVKTVQDSKKEKDKDFGVFVMKVNKGFVDNSEDFDTAIITIHDDDQLNVNEQKLALFAVPKANDSKHTSLSDSSIH